MVYCITNQKGGVGKSTTADAMLTGLKRRGATVLGIDLDPQGTLTDFYRADTSKPNILDVMLKKATIDQAIQHTQKGDIVAFSMALANPDKLPSKTKEFTLKNALEPILKSYDYIIIDTPPTLSEITVNALVCADRVIIPTLADRESMRGISQLYDTVSDIKELRNPQLTIEGVLIVNQPPRGIFTSKMTTFLDKDFAERYGVKIFKSRIRQGVAIKEAHGQGADIFEYASKSGVVRDYNNFIDEIIGV